MSISKKEQRELFDQYETPAHIQAHCNEVARVAELIAEQLNQKGYHIDIETMRGAASVHDVVRLMPHHDLEGAKILREIGHEKEAELVEHHMSYFPFNAVELVNEQDVLCLADRVVMEHDYVGIDRRMEYLMNKPNFKPEMRPKIIEAREHTRMLIQQIEDVIGITLDDLCRKVS